MPGRVWQKQYVFSSPPSYKARKFVEGYIKIYRKLQEKGYYKNSVYVHLWVHLLLKATHKIRELMWDGGIIKLKPGQFITGRKQLSEETGIKETTIERVLNLLESEHQIGQQKNNKFRLITIRNWSKYQAKDAKVDSIVDNKRTSSGHLADTNKNVKNVKNIGKPFFKGQQMIKDYGKWYVLERGGKILFTGKESEIEYK